MLLLLCFTKDFTKYTKLKTLLNMQVIHIATLEVDAYFLVEYLIIKLQYKWKKKQVLLKCVHELKGFLMVYNILAVHNKAKIRQKKRDQLLVVWISDIQVIFLCVNMLCALKAL